MKQFSHSPKCGITIARIEGEAIHKKGEWDTFYHHYPCFFYRVSNFKRPEGLIGTLQLTDNANDKFHSACNGATLPITIMIWKYGGEQMNARYHVALIDDEKAGELAELSQFDIIQETPEFKAGWDRLYERRIYNKTTEAEQKILERCHNLDEAQEMLTCEGIDKTRALLLIKREAKRRGVETPERKRTLDEIKMGDFIDTSGNEAPKEDISKREAPKQEVSREAPPPKTHKEKVIKMTQKRSPIKDATKDDIADIIGGAQAQKETEIDESFNGKERALIEFYKANRDNYTEAQIRDILKKRDITPDRMDIMVAEIVDV